MTDPIVDDSAVSIDCPVDDTPVLVDRVINPAADTSTLSRFGDNRWNLTPGIFESHVPTTRLNFHPVPEQYRRDVKLYIWLLINYDAPRKMRSTNVSRLALRSITLIMPRFVSFVVWLDRHGIDQFAAVTTDHLDSFLADILAADMSDEMKAATLTEVVRLWSYRALLPSSVQLSAPPPWDGEDANDLIGVVTKSGVNRTPRIHPDTVDTLLMWALRFTSSFADDIIASFCEYTDLWCFSGAVLDHSVRAANRRERVDVSQVAEYLDGLRATGGSLPGRRMEDGSVEIYWPHIVRVLRTSDKAFLHGKRRELVEQSGLPISEEIRLTTPITATIDGKSWLPKSIPYVEAPRLAVLLRTACFIVVAYLSGMRTGEVLNLERGCVSMDPVTELWTVTGRKFKGARGSGGDKLPEGEIRDDPWVVVRESARAIEVLEKLHDQNLLFPNHLLPHAGHRSRATGADTGRDTVRKKFRASGRSAPRMAVDVANFIEWINEYAENHGRRGELIPPDPHGRISPSRFRRTLAWHIVRKPRGLVAGMIQYGHLRVQMTLGYSGAYDSGFPDEYAFEEWLLRLEQLAEDHEQLQSGEHVSGPGASTYRHRVESAHQKFAGRVLKNSQQARDMLANPLLQIFPGRAMTCVFDRNKALCQTQSAEGDPRITPDQDDCRRECRNIAFTDRDIEQMGQQVEGMRTVLDDALAPSPRHHRAHAELERLQHIISEHDRDRDTMATP